MSHALRPLIWPAIRVDVSASPDQLEAMVGRVEQNFRHLGETDPHWSVLTAERFRAANISLHEDEFIMSGKEPVAELVATANRCGLALGAFERCFELGCGTGRMTIWLAEHFREVIAADISTSHLRLAKETVQRFGNSNVRFAELKSIASICELAEIDAFVSIITLQHNPPPVIGLLLRTALGRLRQGGIAYFQVPTYRVGYVFDAAEYLTREVEIGRPEMHVFPQPELLRLLDTARCQLLEIREDGAAGGNQISNRLLVQKR